MSKVLPETNAENETTSATEEKSIVLTDAETDMFKKFMAKIQEKYAVYHHYSFLTENSSRVVLHSGIAAGCSTTDESWATVTGGWAEAIDSG